MNRQRAAHAVEFGVAALLTLVAVALHFRVMLHAGPLWRDEISSLRVATMPSMAEFWSALVYDPVPALFFLLLRLWSFLGWSASDEGLRTLGLFIGLGVLGAIWSAAWMIKKSPPLWALLLFGLSPVALVWGDSIRAYGIGCLWNILVLAFFWKLLCERPRVVHVALATTAALFSVHSLFSNSFLLFAAIAGGVVVTIYRRWWRTMFVIVGIGVVAALSLLSYVPIIRQTRAWTGICNSPITSAWIFTMLFRATDAGGNLAATLWITGALLACLAFVLTIAKPRFVKLCESETNLMLYTGTTLLIAISVSICFFRFVGWATSLWYYLPLMATGVFCIDSISTLARKSAIAVVGHSLFIVIAAAAFAPRAFQATNVRLTNVDLTAELIAQHAQPQDLVIVDYYLYAISFQRYYHGRAPWLSVPNVSDASLHRWDLLKETMDRPHPIRPILKRIDETLLAGHEVYVVGLVPPNRASVFPPDLPPASQNNFGWIVWPYVRLWTSQVAYTLQAHSSRGTIIPILSDQPTSTAECIRAAVVSGWKDGQVAASQ